LLNPYACRLRRRRALPVVYDSACWIAGVRENGAASLPPAFRRGERQGVEARTKWAAAMANEAIQR